MARQVSLIVEDGTIVAGANSFVTEVQIVAHALRRGVVLPSATDEELDAVAVLGIKAMDYLNVMPWRGEVVSVDQTTPWPRKNLYVTPEFPEDDVPSAVIQAQLQLTLLANAGVDLLPTSTGIGYLIKEKIGPIENVYSEKVGVTTTGLPILPSVAGLLEPWLLTELGDSVPIRLLAIGGREYDC